MSGNYWMYQVDILLHRNHSELKFSVHCKSMNKNDWMDFYSHHIKKIKSGILIGFYLRARRICSPEYIREEEYIKILLNSYTTLYIS